MDEERDENRLPYNLVKDERVFDHQHSIAHCKPEFFLLIELSTGGADAR
jgi:hypothetical protein